MRHKHHLGEPRQKPIEEVADFSFIDSAKVYSDLFLKDVEAEMEKIKGKKQDRPGQFLSEITTALIPKLINYIEMEQKRQLSVIEREKVFNDLSNFLLDKLSEE